MAGDTATPRRRRGRTVLTVGIVVLAVLLTAGIALTVYGMNVANQFSENLHRGGEAQLPAPSTIPSSAPSLDPEKPGEPPVNFVLMGVDKREHDRGRSDSLMLAHLTGDRTHLYLISFPRDMWVTLPGRGKDKINAAYAYGGTQLTVQTLQDLLGIRVDHVAMINMEGFVALTDAVGGVTIDNPHTFSIDGFDFPKGELTLEGPEALAFVRARKQLPRGDLDRAYNQRMVVRAIINKGMSPAMIANPKAFTEFVGKVADTMQVDQGMTEDRVRELFLSLRLTPDGIVQMQAPIKGFGTSPNGLSIDIVDEPRLAELAEALRNDTVDEYYARYGDS